MCKCPSSYSNRMLAALFASLALHGLLALAASGLRFGGPRTMFQPAIVPVSVRFVSAAEVREPRSASAAPVEAVAPRSEDRTGSPKPDEAPADSAPQRESAASSGGGVRDDPGASQGKVPENPKSAGAAKDPRVGDSSGPLEVPFGEAAAGLGLPMPAYPEVAKRWGYEGTVLVRVAVAPDGRVSDAVVLRSSGHEVLDSACLNTIRKKWRFPAPGREIVTSKEFVFRLRR